MPQKIVRKEESTYLNVLGDQQYLKLSGEDTDGQFATIVQENPPGAQIPKHVHTKEDEIFRVLSGEVEFELGDRKEILKSGDMVYLPKNIPHGFKVIGNENATVILDIFPAGIEKMFEELSNLPEGPPDFPKVAEICGRYGVSFVQD